MLKDYVAYIFDLDGCIYRGNTVITGAAEKIGGLRKLGKKILFLTNNATKTPEEYVDKLTGMGIDTNPKEILTSATATALYLAKNFGKASIFPVGERGLIVELQRAGHRIINVNKSGEVEFVVACLDFSFTYAKMKAACQAIFAGAKFVATNADPNVPVEGGYMPGAGAIVSAISTATGVKPLVIGKPSRHIVEIALERLGVRANRTVIVGDRLDTDVQSGKMVGAFTILVLSGATSPEKAKKTKLKPDLILPSISHIPV
jgi:4-nitrophenyl phosphatase